MRVTAKRLRGWVVVAAVLLVAIVVGFFLYGRHKFRQIARDLPGRLGVNIQESSKEITYSQSSQGHTLFTLKASKEFQLKSGHVLLHNVDITMYGPPGSGRTDHIFGSDFDYDQSEGIAISRGEVRIQLEGLDAGDGRQGHAAASDAIQVQTSGLTFTQKTGEASTSQPVHFKLPRASGSAVGADYNAKSGVLVLDSQVRITTNSRGKTAQIGAAHGTLERAKMRAVLTGATLDYEAEHGSADHATVDFRQDGTAKRIDAQGHVRMATNQGATTEAGAGVFLLNAESQPLRADLGGGVTFADAKPGAQMHGSAESGTLLFAAAPGPKGTTELRHAEFLKNVQFAVQSAGNAGYRQSSEARELTAQKVDVDFARTAAKQPLQASKAVAVGNPVLTMQQTPAAGARNSFTQTTRVRGDELVATLGADNTLEELDGSGHTEIESRSGDGARETSRGDALRAMFKQQAAPAKGETADRAAGAPARRLPASVSGGKRMKPGPKMQTVLETAVQDGHVVVTEIPAAHPTAPGAGEMGPGYAAPEPLTAWGDHAEYHAADQRLTLTGHPRLRQGATTQLSAERIVYHRDSQDAEAAGDVQATYTQVTQGTQGTGHSGAVPGMGESGPVHVIAERATMHHATGEAEFYGTAQERARMWQGSDSLLAPTIQIDRAQSVLKAWGDETRPEVLANFTSAMGAKHEETLVSVASRRLDYSDKKRQADFEGDVTAEQSGQTMRAEDALVFLKPEEKSSSEHAGKGNSQIDRVVATGHVVFTQPGRRGEGAKLVYTADDGKYVLTGTPEAKPQLWDREHGTTTGTALIFNSQDDSVEVSGGKSSAVTQTRAPR